MFTFTILYCWNCTHVHDMTTRRMSWTDRKNGWANGSLFYFLAFFLPCHRATAATVVVELFSLYNFAFYYMLFLSFIHFLILSSSLLSTPVREFYSSIQYTHNTQCFVFASSATISPYKCKHMYIELTAFPSTCYTQRILKPIFEFCAMMEYNAHCLSRIVCLLFFFSSYFGAVFAHTNKRKFQTNYENGIVINRLWADVRLR